MQINDYYYRQIKRKYNWKNNSNIENINNYDYIQTFIKESNFGIK